LVATIVGCCCRETGVGGIIIAARGKAQWFAIWNGLLLMATLRLNVVALRIFVTSSPENTYLKLK